MNLGVLYESCTYAAQVSLGTYFGTRNTRNLVCTILRNEIYDVVYSCSSQFSEPLAPPRAPRAQSCT